MTLHWRPWWKRLAGMLAAFAAALASVLVPFETPPGWRMEPASLGARAALEAQRPAIRVQSGPLRAGWARAALTPTLGAKLDDGRAGQFRELPLAGYGARRGRPSTGVRQDLWTKALALEVADQRVVLVASDLLIVPREVAEEVLRHLAAEPGLRRDQVYFTATHTHGSLGGWGEGWVAEQFGGPFVPEVRVWLVGQLTRVARQAWASKGPASIGFDAFDAPEGVRNRLVGDAGTVDPEFAYFRVRRDDDGREALWGSYSAHATVLGAGEMRFHGDYPGVWQESVESATGGLALFAAGAVGSHGPKATRPGWDGARQLGEDLARRTVESSRRCRMMSEVQLGTAAVTFGLPPLRVRLGDHLGLRAWAAARVLPVADRTTLQAVRIGPWVWLSTPCDFSGELALELKQRARAADLRCAVTSFNGDYLGYVIPTRYASMDGYESRTMSFYGPALTEGFMETLGGLMEVLGSPAVSRP